MEKRRKEIKVIVYSVKEERKRRVIGCIKNIVRIIGNFAKGYVKCEYE